MALASPYATLQDNVEGFSNPNYRGHLKKHVARPVFLFAEKQLCSGKLTANALVPLPTFLFWHPSAALDTVAVVPSKITTALCSGDRAALLQQGVLEQSGGPGPRSPDQGPHHGNRAHITGGVPQVGEPSPTFGEMGENIAYRVVFKSWGGGCYSECVHWQAGHHMAHS